MKRAVFLDRDNTINEDTGYTHKVEDFKLMPEALSGLQALHDAGFVLIVITNQSGIGRGYYTEADMHAFHAHMCDHLKERGVKIAHVYHCGHHPDDECVCRKPKTHMIERAIDDWSIEKEGSWMIGDKPSDIEMGTRAGVRTIHVGEEEIKNPVPHHRATDLKHAAEIIIRSL